MKKSIAIVLFAIVVWAWYMVSADVCRTFKQPESMANVNFSRGISFSVRAVTLADTATSVRFAFEPHKGYKDKFNVSSSYLLDEQGRRYAMRSVEGIEQGKVFSAPDGGVVEFTVHFEPLPQATQVFDYIEGNSPKAFMLLGIHDGAEKPKLDSLQALLAKNPYTVPNDWYRTDSITVRGRIEGYDSATFHCSMMECHLQKLFVYGVNGRSTQVLDIAADGTFSKTFAADCPVQSVFETRNHKAKVREIPFYACPGETIDITVRKNDIGQYECHYNNGSSKEVEHWLKSNPYLDEIVRPLEGFKGKATELGDLPARTWRNLLWRVQILAKRDHFSPMEMQLALANAQMKYGKALLRYALQRGISIHRPKAEGGDDQTLISDSAEWRALCDPKTYATLHGFDFDNPLLLTANEDFSSFVNSLQFSPAAMAEFNNTERDTITIHEGPDQVITRTPIKSWTPKGEQDQLDADRRIWREMTGSKRDNMVVQHALFQQFFYCYKNWQESETLVPKILADTIASDSLRQRNLSLCSTVENRYPEYLAMITHPYLRARMEQYHAEQQSMRKLTTPLPQNNLAADFIRSLNRRFSDKYLVLDFWGMSCGPCRAAIQQSKAIRAEFAKRDDVKLIFITDDSGEAYVKYVAEWLADEEVISIPHADFMRLCDLFQFSAIPHYETITPHGRRVGVDYSVHLNDDMIKDFNTLKERLR